MAVEGITVGGRKITAKELQAPLGYLAGYSQQELADLIGCCKGNIQQKWQSLFFKLGTYNNGITTIKLIDLGAIKHLVICFLIASSTLSGINPASTDPIRPPRPTVQARTRRQDDIAGLTA
ncbi:MAG: hypothetical protein MJK10_03970 [Pseudomonadales bacterium]|nr:hypothetical protein [Pseudomonadales bacterium]